MFKFINALAALINILAALMRDLASGMGGALVKTYYPKALGKGQGDSRKVQLGRFLFWLFMVVLFGAGANSCEQTMSEKRLLLERLEKGGYVAGQIRAEVGETRLKCADEENGALVRAVLWRTSLLEGDERLEAERGLLPFRLHSNGTDFEVEGPPPDLLGDLRSQEWPMASSSWIKKRRCAGVWVGHDEGLVTVLGELSGGKLRPEQVYLGSPSEWAKDVWPHVVYNLVIGSFLTFCFILSFLCPPLMFVEKRSKGTITGFPLWKFATLLRTTPMQELASDTVFGLKGSLLFHTFFIGFGLLTSGYLVEGFLGAYFGLTPHGSEGLVVSVLLGIFLALLLGCGVFLQVRRALCWRKRVSIEGRPFDAALLEVLRPFESVASKDDTMTCSRSHVRRRGLIDGLLPPAWVTIPSRLGVFTVNLRPSAQPETHTRAADHDCRLTSEPMWRASASLQGEKVEVSWDPGFGGDGMRMELLHWLESRGADVFVGGEEFDRSQASVFERRGAEIRPERSAAPVEIGLTDPAARLSLDGLEARDRSDFFVYAAIFALLVTVPVVSSAYFLLADGGDVAIMGRSFDLKRWFFWPLTFLVGALWVFDLRPWVRGGEHPTERPLLRIDGSVLKFGAVHMDLARPFVVNLSIQRAARTQGVVLMTLELRFLEGKGVVRLATPVLRSAEVDALGELEKSAPIVGARDFRETLWPTLLRFAQAHGNDLDWAVTPPE